MKNAQRNKKIYAICIALLFIISSSAALIPTLEVRAAGTEVLYLKDTPLINFIPSGDELFNMPDYRIGVQSSNLSEEILEGCNSGILLDTAQNNGYVTKFNLMKDFLNDPTTGVTGWNSGYSLNEIQIKTSPYSVTDDWLIDYLHGNTSYYTYVTIVQDSSTFHITFYISTSELSYNAFVCNGGGYFYDTDATVYYFSLDFSENSFSNGTPINLNTQTYNVSNTTVPPLGSSFFTFLSYSDFKVYFTWQSGHGNTYSNLNSKTAIRDFVSAGNISDFLIDRRTLMDNWSDGNLTVDTDPVSLDNLGSWLLLCQPQGELPDGTFNIKYVPTKYTSDLDNVSVSYDWRFELHTGSAWSNHVASFLPGGCKAGGESGLKQVITGNTNIGYQYTNNDWQQYTFKSILGQIKDVNNTYIDDEKIKRTPSMYDMLSALVYSGSLNTKTFQGNISSGLSDLLGFNISLSEGTQTVTSCFVTIYAEVSDNNGHTRNSSCTYDFLTGKVDVQNTASTDNDISNVPQGVDPQDYQTTINNMLYPSGGGNGSGSGGNSNANGGNSTSTGMGGNANATANNEINVKSNWQYFIESTEESTENANGLAAIQDGYEEVINFDYQNDSFLRFLFTSGIWSIHPFDYILAFLGTMVTIGIFTGILKLFRG